LRGLNYFLYFFPAGFAFLLSACGVSPLFQHEDEKTPPPAHRNEVEPQHIVKIANGTAQIAWKDGVSVGESSFTVTSDQPITQFDSWADMPDMGHGTSVFNFERISDREYFVSEVWFTMPGRWVLSVEINQQTFEFELDVQ